MKKKRKYTRRDVVEAGNFGRKLGEVMGKKMREAWERHNPDKVVADVNAIAVMPGDDVNHPKHYTSHPSGVECITVVEHMSFCAGNAIKYIWRAGIKSDDPIKDLEKAKWYIERELERIKGLA